MNKFNIKGIIFDYGGTLDTNGGHWGAVIWSGYEKYQVPVNLNAFQEAYTYANVRWLYSLSLSRSLIF